MLLQVGAGGGHLLLQQGIEGDAVGRDGAVVGGVQEGAPSTEHVAVGPAPHLAAIGPCLLDVVVAAVGIAPGDGAVLGDSDELPAVVGLDGQRHHEQGDEDESEGDGAVVAPILALRIDA